MAAHEDWSMESDLDGMDGYYMSDEAKQSEVNQLKATIASLVSKVAALESAQSTLESQAITAGDVERLLADSTLDIEGAASVRVDPPQYVPPIQSVEGLPACDNVRHSLVGREYDENGTIVVVASETGTTPATIDAGHTLRFTSDFVRFNDEA